jgi:hypothetical protein
VPNPKIRSSRRTFKTTRGNERGRPLAALDEPGLQQRYIAEHRAWAAEPKNRDAMRVVADVCAEFRLRNEAEPDDGENTSAN